MPPKKKTTPDLITPPTEVLAAEAAPAPGLDMLRPLTALTRRQRADATAAFAQVQLHAVDLDPQALDTRPDSSKPAKAAAWSVNASVLLQVIADMQDALMAVAVDREAFAEWAEHADEAQLIQLFNAYQASMGEAAASPS